MTFTQSVPMKAFPILIAVLVIYSGIAAWGQCRPLQPITGNPSPCTGIVNEYSVHDAGSDVVWTVTGNPSNPPFDPIGYYHAYAWSTPGQYTITASIPGCSFIPEATRTMTVNVGNADLINPLSITGPASSCLNVLNTFSVPAVPDESRLQWNIYPSDPANTMTVRGRFMDINFSISGSYTVTAKYQNSQCTASTSSIYIQAGLPAVVTMSGPSSVCTGVSNSIYTPSSTSSQYTYAWSVMPASAGTIVPSGNNGSVTWGAIGLEAIVRLTITNSCGSTIVDKPVSIKSLPPKPVFNVDKTAACSSEWINLSLSNYSSGNTTSFTPLPSETQNANGSTPSIKLNSSASLTIKYTSPDGCIGPVSDAKLIDITNIAFPPWVTGSQKVCSNATVTYTASGVASPYTWSVPPNVCLINGSNQTTASGNSVSIKWLVTGNHTIRVVSANTNCGIAVKGNNYDVHVQPPIDPTLIPDIEGPSIVCTSSDQAAYFIRYPSSATSSSNLADVSWQITNGTIQTALSGAPSTIVRFTGPTTHTITASLTNSCGGTYQKTKTVTSVISSSPKVTGSISGNSTACNGTIQSYFAYVASGSSYYWQSSGTVHAVGTVFPESSISTSFSGITRYHHVAFAVRNATCDQVIAVRTVETKKDPQTISASLVSNAVYLGTSNLVATSTSGAPVTFRAVDPTRISINGNTATFLMAGLCQVICSAQATSCYYAPDDYILTINVAKRNQTITPITVSPVCAGSEVTLNCTSTSGLPVRYTSSNTNIATVKDNVVATKAAGSVTIYVDQTGDANNNAAPREFIPITVKVKPSLSVTVDPYKPQTICSGTETSATLSSTSSGVAFSWSVNVVNGVTGAQAVTGATLTQSLGNSGNSPGSVSYIAKSVLNGCETTLDHIVTVKPTANVTATSDQTICSGNTTDISLTSNVPNTTFSWNLSSLNRVSGAYSGSGTQISQTLTNYSTSPLALGTVTYKIYATASDTACVGTSDDVTITVNPVATVNSASTRTVCSNDAFTHDVSSLYAPATVSWTATPSVPGIFVGLATSGTGNIVGPLIHTSTSSAFVTYHVTPYVEGCAGTPKDIVITVKPNPAASISGNNIVCSGTSGVTLTANPAGSSYLWSNAKTTRAITITSSGTYSVTITHSTGCKSSASKTLTSGTTPPAPTINIANNTLCYSGVTQSAFLVSSQADSYLWTGGFTSPYITVYSTGTYSVTITQNGCTMTTSKFVPCAGVSPMVVMQTQKENTIAREAESLSYEGEMILIYPNPADDELIIELSVASERPTAFRLINPFGQPVVESAIPARQQKIAVKTKDFSEGMFVLEVIHENQRIIRKVMIMH